MVHVIEAWPDLKEPVFRTIFDGEFTRFSEKNSNLSELFSMKTSDKNYEKDSSAGALGDLDEFTGTVEYDDSYQGYDSTYEFTEYAKGIKIERKLYDDDLYNIMNKRPAQLGYSVARTREKHGAQIFNEAFTTVHSSFDQLSLCNTAHTSTGGGANQSNSGTTAFSATAVEATRRLMTAFKGDRDEVQVVNPDMLLLPIELEETGYEIINSKGKVDVSTNNVNFHFGKYKMLIWANFLTSAKRWFMIDSYLMKQFLLWFDRVKPEFMQDKDSDTLLAKYCVYTRYGRGWSDWRWLYGHNPA